MHPITLIAQETALSPTAEFWWGVLRGLIIILFVLIAVPPIIWWERRLLSWMQYRIGPNRVGPFGLLQPIADGVKLFFKEEVVPAAVDRLVYVIAPAAALFPAFVLGATVVWGPNPLLTPVADIDAGVLWVLAISSLGVYGVVLGGWASNNKYSLLGGLRSSAQLISYELAMGVALYSVLLVTGSLKLSEVVASQHTALWGIVPWAQNWFILTPYGVGAGIIFFICIVAETNRAPFDLPEAESELIAGFHTEYSSMKFAVFFMGEYAMMAIFGAVFANLFLGGWSPLPLNWEYLAAQANGAGIGWLGSALSAIGGAWLAPVWFLGKVFGILTIYIWIRATLPRLRYDQLMSFGWKILLPVAALNFVIAAIWMLFGWTAFFISAAIVVISYLTASALVLKPMAAKSVGKLELVDVPANTTKTVEISR